MPEEVSFREQAEAVGVRLAAGVAPRLPLTSLRSLARLVGSLVYGLDSHGRRVALANLEAAFGVRIPPQEKIRIAKRSYQQFARTMLELFWSPNLTPQNAWTFARVEGLEHHVNMPGQPIIYYCLHFSNFEWLGLYMPFHSQPQHVVSQKFKNPLLGSLFDRLRSRTGNTVLPQERAMIRMFKNLKSGGCLSVLTDLNLDPREPGVVITQFGGLKACVTQLHAALALKTGVPIIPVECLPEPDGTYRMVFHKPVEYGPETPASVLVQRCWDILEASIHKHPECWLWSYKHWRFKPSQEPSERYPFYANQAPRFDRLLASESRGAIKR